MKFSTCCMMVALAAAALLMGCGASVDPAEAVAAANSTNIQRVANLYLAYQTESDWVGPPDEAKFKEFIRGLPGHVLARIGIEPTSIDEIFISERDGQPFKVRYRVVGSMMGSTEPVVFEAVGVDGKRMVATLGMTQIEAGDAEYEALWAGKGPVADTTTRQ